MATLDSQPVLCSDCFSVKSLLYYACQLCSAPSFCCLLLAKLEKKKDRGREVPHKVSAEVGTQARSFVPLCVVGKGLSEFIPLRISHICQLACPFPPPPFPLKHRRVSSSLPRACRGLPWCQPLPPTTSAAPRRGRTHSTTASVFHLLHPPKCYIHPFNPSSSQTASPAPQTVGPDPAVLSGTAPPAQDTLAGTSQEANGKKGGRSE